MDSPTALLLQDTLDTLCSSRSSTLERATALTTLEHFLATICVPKGSESKRQFEAFLESQDAFECNIPSRILSWISSAIIGLEILVSKGYIDYDREEETFTLASHLIQALSIIQGVALNHKPSKRFLGRKYALKESILLDLLLVSRHLSSPPSTPGKDTSTSATGELGKKKVPPPQLASALLDTLLCILVDSSIALRAFEEAKGVQVAVKILKRAGTPREVRMKCLEFLYFYLLDERSFAIPSSTQRRTGSESSLPLAAPSPPTSPNPMLEQSFQDNSDGNLLPAFNFTPRPKLSHVPSSFDSSLRASQRSGSSPRSNSSLSSAFKLSTLSSNSSWSTGTQPEQPRTPPRSRALSASSKLLMLRKEVDFVPMTPKKAQIAGLGVGVPVPSRTPSNRSYKETDVSRTSSPRSEKENKRQPSAPNPYIKTTEEKKELLGSMLGNVDALVEGVKKAGIWGLG